MAPGVPRSFRPPVVVPTRSIWRLDTDASQEDDATIPNGSLIKQNHHQHQLQLLQKKQQKQQQQLQQLSHHHHHPLPLAVNTSTIKHVETCAPLASVPRGEHQQKQQQQQPQRRRHESALADNRSPPPHPSERARASSGPQGYMRNSYPSFDPTTSSLTLHRAAGAANVGDGQFFYSFLFS